MKTAPIRPSQSKPPKHRRRNGKIASLPKTVRDSINTMIQDGLPYPAILKKLGPDGRHLDKHCLSEWKAGGYRDWIEEQQWLQEMRAQQQFALELLQDGDHTRLHQVVIQLAITQVFQALRDFTPHSLKGRFEQDPSHYTSLLNSVSRLSREALVFRKYNDLCALTNPAKLKRLNAKRKLTEKETRALVLQVDDILGLRDNQANEPEDHEPAGPTAGETAAAHNAEASGQPNSQTTGQPNKHTA